MPSSSHCRLNSIELDNMNFLFSVRTFEETILSCFYLTHRVFFFFFFFLEKEVTR